MIAALYVEKGGVYWNLDGVEPWDIERDARKYAGPWPVVAHPPCARWGRYWHGGPSAKVRRIKGDDDGCFDAALRAVRAFGGVLEHPEASAAWLHFGLRAPPKSGGWAAAGDWMGWTCCVEQGHYGHRARKATWLYAIGVDLPKLEWGKSGATIRLEDGFHSAEERKLFRSNRALAPGLADRKKRWLDSIECASGMKEFKRLSVIERAATPIPFRDLLLGMARSVKCAEAA